MKKVAVLLLCTLALLVQTCLAFRHCVYVVEQNIVNDNKLLEESIKHHYGVEAEAFLNDIDRNGIKHLASKKHKFYHTEESKDNYFKFTLKNHPRCTIKVCVHSENGKTEDEYEYGQQCPASVRAQKLTKPVAPAINDLNAVDENARTLTEGRMISKKQRLAKKLVDKQGRAAMKRLSLTDSMFDAENIQKVDLSKHAETNSIFVMGDVHGDADQFCGALYAGGFVDKAKWPCTWTAGKGKTLVILGDIADRGPNDLVIIRLVMKWMNSGLPVFMVLGNHEIMRLLGMADYANRDAIGATASGILPLDIRKFLLRLPIILQLDDNIFVHGGLSTVNFEDSACKKCHYSQYDSIEEFDSYLRKVLVAHAREAANGFDFKQFLDANAAPDDVILNNNESPTTTRNFATGTRASTSPYCTNIIPMLARFGARRMFVGHTSQANVVEPRCDGLVVLTDVGMTRWASAGKSGHFGIEVPILDFKNFEHDPQVAEIRGGVLYRHLYDLKTHKTEEKLLCAKAGSPSCNFRDEKGEGLPTDPRLYYFDKNTDFVRKTNTLIKHKAVPFVEVSKYTISKLADNHANEFAEHWFRDMSRHFLGKELPISDFAAEKICTPESTPELCNKVLMLLAYLHAHQGTFLTHKFVTYNDFASTV